jgi:hypothetical protein
MPNWKIIAGYPDYAISDTGQVKSLRFDRELKLSRNEGGTGYQYVNLLHNKVRKTTAVHKLVIEHFGNAKPGENFVVDHKDSNKINNQINNLEWVSIQENTLRYYANDDKRALVIDLRAQGKTLHQISKIVNKSVSFVHQTIIRGY